MAWQTDGSKWQRKEATNLIHRFLRFSQIVARGARHKNLCQSAKSVDASSTAFFYRCVRTDSPTLVRRGGSATGRAARAGGLPRTRKSPATKITDSPTMR